MVFASVPTGHLIFTEGVEKLKRFD
ncbi:MAG: hypothetical protein JWP15_3108, partial [Alphaproteobacteria bacterium]|nr:hypothetical protein [Alphaproteobacteria bacterium]